MADRVGGSRRLRRRRACGETQLGFTMRGGSGPPLALQSQNAGERIAFDRSNSGFDDAPGLGMQAPSETYPTASAGGTSLTSRDPAKATHQSDDQRNRRESMERCQRL